MTVQKKDLLTLLDSSADEIIGMIKLAKELKEERYTIKNSIFSQKTGVLIFEKPSLRTRITFETAINELGGHAINLESQMVGMGKRECVEDVARNLERWVHLIVARTYSHSTVEQLARYCSIPVINALTDTFHPCQAMAFGLTLYEKLSFDKKRNVVFIGDGNNVCNSIMALCSKLGFNFTVVCPKGYEPDPVIQKRCQEEFKKSGGSLTLTNQMSPSIETADVLYTDVWTSMGQESESEKRKKDFSGFQVNMDTLSRAQPDILVTHCLPAHRGEEITSDVLDSDHSIAFDEAENRLHAQKAIIVNLLSFNNG
ncbi:ornithine carbamoyltransferase [Chitinispirillales bacterium ANBcel5]|uniref:ornithine carbamoyltransferase n=1 Tax=Cellulosispirillum alkaliphilum TaxID=3039283 RepID=UPI002A54502B|nr:ornithine carbamoyltransferase [Chitinispirillales bacterium ANBcel5]